MKTIVLTLAAVASVLENVQAACPNMCSGHGSCGNDDICHCYQDWLNGDEAGGDCSKRKCPYEIAWIDTPSKQNKAHALAECANRGVCDRDSGDCECFEGYTGKGCRRTTCPNDCSGHGTCEYLKELRNDLGDNFKHTGDAPTTDQYDHEFPLLWDYHKSRACVCDPKWTDIDCSRRMCPKGNYKLYYDATDNQEVQKITVKGRANTKLDTYYGDDVQFALTFRSTLNEEFTTKTLHLGSTAQQVEDAINSLPNKMIEQVVVSRNPNPAWALTTSQGAANGAVQTVEFKVTFFGSMNTGDQHAFECRTQSCTSGCVPQISGNMQQEDASTCVVTDDEHLDANSILKTVNTECSTRGHCEYDTGICSCFEGYTDEYCSTQTALI